MTTRPTIRWRDLVAHLDGEVVAARAVSVERAFSIIATGGAAARLSAHKAATIHPITINWRPASAHLPAGCYHLLAARSEPVVSMAAPLEILRPRTFRS
jgi:hypothetical protein